jgi:hypothetical protein
MYMHLFDEPYNTYMAQPTSPLELNACTYLFIYYLFKKKKFPKYTWPLGLAQIIHIHLKDLNSHFWLIKQFIGLKCRSIDMCGLLNYVGVYPQAFWVGMDPILVPEAPKCEMIF